MRAGSAGLISGKTKATLAGEKKNCHELVKEKEAVERLFRKVGTERQGHTISLQFAPKSSSSVFGNPGKCHERD